ncbi:MAG: hypothetical protein HYV26_13930 [Candidatus Hydrogenedentes bacterium]|nr:hypothetical protein [Candidatus Hydrogenedentota bacterium]
MLEPEEASRISAEDHGSHRRVRFWLLTLLLTAALAAAVVLFIQYRLANIRTLVQEAISARMGTSFLAERVQVNGFRGIVIRDFATSFEVPDGPVVQVRAPEAQIFIDLGNLLYRELTVDRLQIDGAEIVLERPAERQWLAPRLADVAGATGLEALFAFRVTGKDCTVSLRNVVGETSLSLAGVQLDFSKLADTAEISGKCSGTLSAAPEKTLEATFHYTSPEDFDVRARASGLTAQDLNVFLPAERQLLVEGVLNASVRLSGYPKGAVIVSLETAFGHLLLRDQPAVIAPATGTLSALAAYDTASHVLTFSTAKAESEQIRGRVDGTISFAEPLPRFGLRFETDHVPVQEAIAYLLASQPESFRGVDLAVQDPYQVTLLLNGTTEKPEISVEARLQGGTLKFEPTDEQLPIVNLTLTLMNITWDSASGRPRGVFNIAAGDIVYRPAGVAAQQVSGTLTLAEDGLSLEPFSAQCFGAPVTGAVHYRPGDQRLDFNLSGMVDLPAKNPLTGLLERLDVQGLLNVRCAGALQPDHYTFDVNMDATQAEIAYDWWLKKPRGGGATFNAFNVDIRPKKSIAIVGATAVDTAQISASLEFAHAGGRWRLQSLRAKSPEIDVATINKCMRIPYTATGDVARDATLEWKRAGRGGDDHDVHITGAFDKLDLQPDGAEVPFQLRNVALDVRFEDRREGNTGSMNIKAADATTPPFGGKWFLPLRPEDPELAKRFPHEERPWTFTLAADHLKVPPWEGVDFKAGAFVSEQENGLHQFSAQVGEGRISGAYHFKTDENVSHLQANWERVPAHFLIQHLKFPAALNGLITGNVEYRVDQDDPGTLAGTGTFEIAEGQFSADFVYSMLENRLQGGMGTLPPSLRFSRMRADVELTGDKVITRNVRFESPGITIAGDGNFVLQGDMDYTLKVAVEPGLAEKIPALRENLNIEGHRLTQSPIELAFHITGPAFNPKGAVAGLPPVGVTLVSGAAEVTSEAIKVIDIPRQILLDLFKIGGGIVGAGQ